MEGWGGFRTLQCYVVSSQVLGVVCVVLTGVWMGHYHGGYAWDSSQQQFNVHPLCMVMGLVFLYGDGVLVYRVFRNESKRSVKILHALIHMMALVISIVVAAGIGLLPVSLGINSATEMVSATACILWPGAPGHGGGFLAHGHLRESDLQRPATVRSRGGSGQHARPAAGVFRGARGLRGDQRRVQTTAEPRGRGSVYPLQHSERGLQAQHALTQRRRFNTHPPL
ncbi:plasma membrane ascorbate-dependent reductase CYBRD1 isoform X2 [Ictalurus furcatus]|uniref:plasma membrane ascorbate-dependent reductase CYBRD1 isoform X2 n=1 Tax=Ictalurus furcatus TaxID=66913 RepID=UPI002350FEA9|nr:plasma membrane ascorbate-dependent reductase CYBRD1 isoform X2 [Ictalurus furcatus]